MPRALSAVSLTALLLLTTASARAEDDCDGAPRRWVAVRLPGPGWSAELARTVLADLRVELGRHGALVCPADTPGLPAPIVTMEIEASLPNLMRLSLDITDPATGKPSARDLDLTSIPPDGHSLAVAVAADELLTSSWIKLALRPVAAAAPPPPPVAVAATAPASRPSAPARNELWLLAAAEHFAGSAWNPGLDLALRRWLLPRWALELFAGTRTAIAETAAHGRVRSRAFPFGLGAQASVVPFAARVRTGAAAALVATPIAFRAEPAAGAVGISQTAIAVYARGELWADVALAGFRLRAAAGAGLPLRSVTADDAGVAVGGARGLELHGQVGLGWGF